MLDNVEIDSKIRVRELLAIWLQDVVESSLAVTTFERYTDIVDRHLSPHIGDVRLKELSPRHVRALDRFLLDQGMSPRTLGLVHNVLSGACKYAIDLDAIYRNPVASVRAPRSEPREIDLPDIDGVRRLLHLAEQEKHRLFHFIHFLVHTGVRRGEALALRWHYVDLGAGYARITQSAVRTQHHGVVVKAPKTSRSSRTVDLDAQTVEILSEHRSQLVQRFDELDLVFPDPHGQIWKTSTIARDLKILGCRVGLPDINFHAFRHFHASVALQQCPNPVVVSRRLGHSNVSTTLNIYGHALPGWGKEVANAFAGVMQDSG